MEACELTRLFLNKVTVPSEPKRAGNPGYGIKTAIRILVYSRLKHLENDTRIIGHLKRNINCAKTLGLHSIPNRTTLGRWWKRYRPIIEEIMHKLAGIIQQLVPTTHLIVDSTPLKDLYDLEAKWGFSSRGPFKGYKLHVAVNQYGLPLNATITTGNLYDSKLLPELIEDLEAPFVVADAGYDTVDNFKAVKAIGATPIIATNPRRGGKAGKVSNEEFFGGMRYPVEQLNGHIKDNVLRNCWIRPKGLAKKASMVMAGLIAVEVVAIWALLEGSCELKVASKYWD
jgi:hypothetical protein